MDLINLDLRCKSCGAPIRSVIKFDYKKILWTCYTCKQLDGIDFPEGYEICPDCSGNGSYCVDREDEMYIKNCKRCGRTGLIDWISKVRE